MVLSLLLMMLLLLVDVWMAEVSRVFDELLGLMALELITAAEDVVAPLLGRFIDFFNLAMVRITLGSDRRTSRFPD